MTFLIAGGITLALSVYLFVSGNISGGVGVSVLTALYVLFFLFKHFKNKYSPEEDISVAEDFDDEVEVPEEDGDEGGDNSASAEFDEEFSFGEDYELPEAAELPTDGDTTDSEAEPEIPEGDRIIIDCYINEKEKLKNMLPEYEKMTRAKLSSLAKAGDTVACRALSLRIKSECIKSGTVTQKDDAAIHHWMKKSASGYLFCSLKDSAESYLYYGRKSLSDGLWDKYIGEAYQIISLYCHASFIKETVEKHSSLYEEDLSLFLALDAMKYEAAYYSSLICATVDNKPSAAAGYFGYFGFSEGGEDNTLSADIKRFDILRPLIKRYTDYTVCRDKDSKEYRGLLRTFKKTVSVIADSDESLWASLSLPEEKLLTSVAEVTEYEDSDNILSKLIKHGDTESPTEDNTAVEETEKAGL